MSVAWLSPGDFSTNTEHFILIRVDEERQWSDRELKKAGWLGEQLVVARNKRDTRHTKLRNLYLEVAKLRRGGSGSCAEVWFMRTVIFWPHIYHTSLARCIKAVGPYLAVQFESSVVE